MFPSISYNLDSPWAQGRLVNGLQLFVNPMHTGSLAALFVKRSGSIAAMLLGFSAGGFSYAASPEAPAATEEAVRATMQITREKGPENVRYGFFNEATGERVARLRIGRITMAYGKQGVFRVAWKPKAVLQDVELQIFDAAAWPAVSDRLAATLGELAKNGTLVMRDVVVDQTADPSQRAEAPTAELTPAGELVLPQARLASGAQARLVLTLHGPQAGTISLIPLDTPRPAILPAGSIPPDAKSR
jgi:hypothetical protein